MTRNVDPLKLTGLNGEISVYDVYVNHSLVKKILQFKKKYVRVLIESGKGAIFWASKPI